MTTRAFACTACSEPVGLIRIMKGDIRLGHLRQPATLHPVRLARSAAEPAASQLAGGNQPQSEGPDTGREDVPSTGLSLPQRTNGTRAASDGRARSRTDASRPSGTPSRLSGQGVLALVHPPGSALRPARTAGRRT